MEEWRREQLFAMACYFYSMNGDYWIDDNGLNKTRENWLNFNVSECDWGMGKHCNSDGRLDRLKFDKVTGLSGTLPPEITLLTALSELSFKNSLWEEELDKAFPSQMTMLPLHTIILEGNYLAGSIPSWFGDFSSLGILRLSVNLLTGTIPTELGLMNSSHIYNLFLSSNLFTGVIPSELAKLTNLINLRLRNNELRGRIPSELGLLSLVRIMNMDNNDLDGFLPSELGLMTSMGTLDLHENAQLTGAMPSDICEMPQLASLKIDCRSTAQDFTCPDENCSACFCCDAVGNRGECKNV
jgi:hypothetical protein